MVSDMIFCFQVLAYCFFCGTGTMLWKKKEEKEKSLGSHEELLIQYIRGFQMRWECF